MSQSVQLKRVNTWHERLADRLIAFPAESRAETAKAFNVTPSWLSSVIHSDLFQDYWKQRSTEASNVVLTNVRDQLAGVTAQALADLGRRLETPQALQTGEVLDIADRLLKHQLPAQSAPTVQVNVVTKSDLASAREAMREARGGGRRLEEADEAQVIDITPGPGVS